MRPLELLPPKKFFRPDEVAGLLSLSRRTVYRMISDGRLAGIRCGGGPWRVDGESLRDLFASGEVPA
jgi:excisionase family DNA binding protein